MTRGGKRPGAGRPHKPAGPDKTHSIRVNDEQWEAIKLKAKEAGLTTTEYIIKKALQD